jgi:hypothetical protein
MKLDRVSVFCCNKSCRLKVKMQCNILTVLCLYLVVVSKRNTLIFSAWCQCKLLTANCFCNELFVCFFVELSPFQCITTNCQHSSA